MSSLHFVVGFSTDPVKAKDRALFFYDADKNKKTVVSVESQTGTNEIGEQAWFTTIWYTIPDYTTEEKRKEEEKYMFIGSTDIDPNDPDWWEKMYGEKAQEGVQETPGEAIEVNP